MRYFIYCLLVWITFGPLGLAAQPFQVGTITAEDFIQGVYEKDPDAAAVILYDYAFIHLDKEYHRSVRLQILNEQGYDWANLPVRTFGRQRITKFTAFVHNLQGQNILSTDVTQASGFTEKIVDGVTDIHFFFPEVQPGTIIEFSFRISPFSFGFYNWQFQYSIPVEYSELQLVVPESHQLRFFMTGYEPLAVSERKRHHRSERYRWVMKDLPALRSEPYSGNIRNYASKISMEVSSLSYGAFHMTLLDNWSDVDWTLRDAEKFGNYLSVSSRSMGRHVQPGVPRDGDQMARIQAVLGFIQANIRWNRIPSLVASSTPGNILRRGEGNAADINLMLTGMLRSLGFEAHPVICSTRNNGVVLSSLPTLSRFNYVMAHVALKDGTSLLLDATDPLCPPGMIPERALNGQGRVMNPDKPFWIDLKTAFMHQDQQHYQVRLHADGTVTGRAALEKQQRAAHAIRTILDQDGDVQKFRQATQEKHPGMTISDFEMENLSDVSLPLTINLEFTLGGQGENTGQIMAIKPLLHQTLEENPFRMEQRSYPVDFSWPVKEEVTMVFELPEDFEVEFLPQPYSTHYKNGIFFTFDIQLTPENTIEVKTLYEVRDPLWLPVDYKGLKAFFSRMVEKQNQQIILKRVEGVRG